VRPPLSRIAFAVASVVFAVTVVLAWRKVLAVPDGRGDITGLFVATLAGALGLALLGDWLRRYERGR
jgi:hypothetical protein